ncbi:MAG TPA: hypothetical protein PLJ21_10640 [Pseudobdellovibrionaceae bacterium]|nr:hypothetical protein [Pseudobdellovibrionaceae bacterium]
MIQHLNLKFGSVFFMSLALVFTFVACSSNPHKAEEIETKMEKSQEVSAGDTLGIKDGNMVVQRKSDMGEELRRLQVEVYETEDHTYGNRKFGSKGIYGVLKDCRMQLSSKANGGEGKLMWTEPMDRVTDKEVEFKIGVDENERLVAVTEEFLKDRIERFKKYKSILQKREDELQEKLDICKAEMRSRKESKTTNSEEKASTEVK